MKKLLQSMAVIACMMISTFSYGQVPTNGLIGYYPFSGNADDESTNSYNGTVNGATLTTDRFDDSDAAYMFNGSSSYILLNHTYDVLPRTVSVWFNVSNITTSLSVMYSSDNMTMVNGMTAVSFRKINNVNKIIYNVANILDTADITTNEWHHTVITVDSGTTSIYLDCDLIGTKTITSYYHSLDVNPDDRVGTSRSLNSYYEGKIDDIRIYNRVLNGTELGLLCEEGMTSVQSVYLNALAVKAYPNPANGLVTLELAADKFAHGYSLKVMNSLSQVVYTSAMDQTVSQIDLSACSKGIYVVCITDASGAVIGTKKIVLQ